VGTAAVNFAPQQYFNGIAIVNPAVTFTGWFGNTILSGDMGGGAGECHAGSKVTLTLTSGGGNVLNLPLSTCSFPFGASDTNGAATNLGALAANGGPTMTHAILGGSNAIDKGVNGCKNAGGALLTTDQRGNPRVNGTYCDSGAYEK
jgi:hypothetical protein